MIRSVLVSLVLAGPAAALTPEELWGAWQEGVAAFGVTLAGEAVPGADGSLTLSGLTVQMGAVPEPFFPPASPVQEVVLRPEGDAVAIDLGLGASTAFGDAYDRVLIEQDGLAITARDGAGGIEYEVAAASLRVASVPLEDLGSFAMEMTNLAATGGGGLGAGGAVTLSASMDGYAYLTSSPRDAIEQGWGSSSAGRATGAMRLSATLAMPAGTGLLDIASPADFVRALEDGLSLRVGFDSDEVASQGWTEGFPFAYQVEGTSRPGTYAMSLDGTAAAVTAEYGGGAATVTAPDLPFGVLDIGYDRVATDVRVPLTREPGDLRYMVALEGFTANEEAWALIDPAGALPREPARFVVDVAGRMGLDLAGLVESGAMGGVPPVPTIESLEIRAFDVAAAGLAATGTGAFTFAGTDPATFLPVPVGQASLRVEGLDRLLDALVTLGAIGPQEATGVRVGAGAFFRAAGPDVRETTLDAQADGSVVVNGIKVQ